MCSRGKVFAAFLFQPMVGVAAAHAGLVLAGQTGEAILAAVEASAGWEDLGTTVEAARGFKAGLCRRALRQWLGCLTKGGFHGIMRATSSRLGVAHM
jgi:hypothetical protein